MNAPLSFRLAYARYLLCLAALLAAWLHGFWTAYGLSLTVISIKKGVMP